MNAAVDAGDVAKTRLLGWRWTYRGILWRIYVLIALVASLLLLLTLHEIDEDIAAVANERGAMIFRLIELTRDWNTAHGTLYAPVTAEMPPNPYLHHPQRDVTTEDGRQLTMVNPALMTRQLADIAERTTGIRFHLTSLQPLRPENTADAWEGESLRLFQQGGVRERLGYFSEGGGGLSGAVHRYMAPLHIKPPCLQCHDTQGFRVGDVGGGISVTLPAEQLTAISAQRRRQAVALYLVGFGLVAGLAHLVAARARRHVLALHRVNRQQEEVIAARTRDLSETNAALEREIAEVEAAHRKLEASQARYRAVIDSSQNGIVVIEDGRTTYANDRMARIVACQPEDLLATPLVSWVAPEDRGWFADRLQRQLAGEAVPVEYRLRLLHSDGRTRKHVDVQIGAEHSPGGRAMLVASFRDMSEKLAAEQERLIAAAVFGNAAEGIMVTDRNNVILRVNPAFTAITGYTPAEALGKTPNLLKSGRHDAAFFAEMWQRLEQTGRWEGEIWNRRKNGEIFPEWLAVTTIPDESGEGRHVSTFIDITQRKAAEEIILHRANFDALTDLPNRTLFDDRLAGALALARRHQHCLALLYVDLDHFKAVNDTLGHAAGDGLLVEAARRMRGCVRESDTVARLGGDEFALILPDLCGQHEAEELAQRINRALAEPFLLAEGEARVSGSIGIAVYPLDASDEQRLRKVADSALYAAKAAGRNTYRLAPVAL